MAVLYVETQDPRTITGDLTLKLSWGIEWTLLWQKTIKCQKQRQFLCQDGIDLVKSMHRCNTFTFSFYNIFFLIYQDISAWKHGSVSALHSFGLKGNLPFILFCLVDSAPSRLFFTRGEGVSKRVVSSVSRCFVWLLFYANVSATENSMHSLCWWFLHTI